MDKFPLTKKGFLRLEQELKTLKGVERPNVIAAIAEARSHGDLSENAEYSAAKEKQGFIEGRIQELEAVVSRAQIIDPAEMSGDVIRFGATVSVVDVDTDTENCYQIVGDYEADINDNKISLSSPLAKALIGKEVGDEVVYMAPGGKFRISKNFRGKTLYQSQDKFLAFFILRRIDNERYDRNR